MAFRRLLTRTRIRLPRRLFFAALAVALFMAVGEGIIRLGGWATLPQETVFTDVYDPDYRLLPGAPNPFAQMEDFFNGSGFRGPDLTMPKPTGVVSIVCTGDSTTHGAFTDVDKTYTALLAAGLQRRGLHVEALNAGIPGTTLWQQRRLIEQRLLDYQPDLLVMYASPGFSEKLLYLRRAMEDGFVLREVQRGLAGFHGYRLLRRWLRPPRFGDVIHQYESDPAKRVDVATAFHFARRDVEIVRQKAVAQGVKILVVPLLEREAFAQARERGLHADDAAWPPLLHEVNTAMNLLDTATELGVPSLNAADAFLERSYREALFVDEVHFTPGGHALMADLLTEEICRRKWLPAPCLR
ncbi:MAG: SGNH/GDSL hydrolase family protein [Candidatus Lernaella stagnicola]|nr:SGNH/GDSL hydrolase family protein [Candidatus Lernaella stagnicola]